MDIVETSLQRILKDDKTDLAQVAESVGVSFSTVWRWREGKSIPRRRQVQPLLVALKDKGLTQAGIYTLDARDESN
ncbi:hypothetical protein [Methylomagnum ishizawai]|uniref:hypothetical protein n=1 Tax=Methylomagnum ishizawai TaxID=1760988 RepID=UPI000A152235|nr:hypothetical protein [Methylomagnum ishizawai]